MTLERSLLTALPHPATEDEYRHAAAELERLLMEVPGAVAVYSYGSIAAPGISDLDRLLVVENGRPVREVWSRLSERTQYLAMHTPVLVDRTTFARHRSFADIGAFEQVWGEPLEVEPRQHPEYSDLVIAAEALVVTALKFAKLAVTGRVKVRPLLCELRNIRLDLGLAKIERHQSPRAWDLVDEIDRIRDEWWTLPEAVRDNRVREMLVWAPPAVDEAIRELGACVEPSPRSGPVRLRAGWQNITLVPGGDLDGMSAARLPILSRSRRLGEARWRWRRRKISLSPGVISLLAGPHPCEYEHLRAERLVAVRLYVDFLARSPGYSAIGFAPVFLP